MAWNPDTYNKFKTERYAPFYDLLKLVNVRDSISVIDLGCGTGELTHKLADHLPGSSVLGIDSSPEMLHDAQTHASELVHFEHRSIQDTVKDGKKYDLVFSNAALQWVEDHEQLFPAVIGLVSEGGQLAVQMPSNHNHFTHQALRELASSNTFRSAFGGWIRLSPVLTIEQYAQILFDHGGKDIVIFEKAYPHVLQDANAVYDWISGTAILPYLERLPNDLKPKFIGDYKTELAKFYKGSAPVFYPFKRVLMSAVF